MSHCLYVTNQGTTVTIRKAQETIFLIYAISYSQYDSPRGFYYFMQRIEN